MSDKINKTKTPSSTSSNTHNRPSSTGYEPVGNHTKARSSKGRKRANSSPSIPPVDESEAGSSTDADLNSDAETSKEPIEDDDPPPTTSSKKSVETKSGLESLVQSLKSSLNRPTSKNGLYGDTSVSMTLPKMPGLMGPSASQYSDWVTKAINYFQTYGLEEVVLMSPADSLTRAFECDPQTPVGTIKGIWSRLHTRAVGLIKTAVELAIGTDLFDEIEEEQSVAGDCNIYEGDKMDMPWLDSFYAKNANLVWVRLKTRQQRYTAHDKANLVRKLLELKYPFGSDPTIFRRRFAALVKNLRNSEITLHDDILMSVWFSALPKELSVLKQALGAKENLKWTDIYDALIQDYSSRHSQKFSRDRERDRRTPRDPKELAAAAREREKRRDTKKQRHESKPSRGCQHCGKLNHNEDKCWTKYPNLIPDRKKKTSKPNNESDTEYSSPFIDSTIIDQLFSELKIESSIPPNEQVLFTPVSDKTSSSYFIFDSAATTHVTTSRELLNEITDVPEISMGTALRGAGTIIKQRGVLQLNKKHKLRQVAYVPNASANLISEGRLCDAGFEIRKDKDSIHVYQRIKCDGKEDVIKSILTGYRWNRLWVYSTKAGDKPNESIQSSIPELEEDSEPEDKKIKRRRNRSTKRKRK